MSVCLYISIKIIITKRSIYKYEQLQLGMFTITTTSAYKQLIKLLYNNYKYTYIVIKKIIFVHSL